MTGRFDLSAIPPLILALVLSFNPQMQQGPAPVPTASGDLRRSLTPLPSQEELLEGRVATLEREVAQLQSDEKGLKTHVHSFFQQRGPTTYMSIHDLSIAMQPHSSTPTTDYFVPLVLSPGSAPSVGGVRSTTSEPIVGQ
jgi:5-hydroxyisourate hydrolase-like protein (transthyretin family)